MRGCVLMSGRPNLYRSALSLLKEQLTSAGDIELDLYSVFWKPVPKYVESNLDGLFRQTTLWGADAGDFSDIQFLHKPAETNTGNLLSMLSGRQLLLDLLMTGVNDFHASQYDFFIYTRPDVCLNDGLSMNVLQASKDSNVAYVPSSGHWRGGVNDQFVLSSWGVMQVYLGLFKKIEQYYLKEKVLMHPELMLKHHLELHKIQIHKLPCENVIFRSPFKFGVG